MRINIADLNKTFFELNKEVGGNDPEIILNLMEQLQSEVQDKINNLEIDEIGIYFTDAFDQLPNKTELVKKYGYQNAIRFNNDFLLFNDQEISEIKAQEIIDTFVPLPGKNFNWYTLNGKKLKLVSL